LQIAGHEAIVWWEIALEGVSTIDDDAYVARD